MANIQIKGINDYLLFILNDCVSMDDLWNELHTLLLSHSFKKDNFYPKAYFDFGKRIVTKDIFDKLMVLLESSRSVLFCGFNPPQSKQRQIAYIESTIRNGEIQRYQGDCVFKGKINPGGKLIVYGNLYVIGDVYGVIEIIGEDVRCTLSSCHQGSICINHSCLAQLNISVMSVIYEENQNIKVKKGSEHHG